MPERAYPLYSQQRLRDMEEMQMKAEAEAEPEKHQRISRRMKWLLLSVAALIDIIVLILSFFAIGEVISPIVVGPIWFGFWVWFKILDVSFVENPSRLVASIAQAVGEFIPFISALPFWTTGTYIIIKVTQSEDRGGLLGKVASVAEVARGKGK